MRYGESKDFPIDFFLALDKPEKLDGSSYLERHAMGVLKVPGIEVPNFRPKEGKVHVVGRHEVGLMTEQATAD